MNRKTNQWREAIQETSHSSLMPSGTYFSRLCDNDRPGITTATRQRQEELGIHEHRREPLTVDTHPARTTKSKDICRWSATRQRDEPEWNFPGPHTAYPFHLSTRQCRNRLQQAGNLCLWTRMEPNVFPKKGVIVTDLSIEACPAKRDQFERFERGPVLGSRSVTC